MLLRGVALGRQKGGLTARWCQEWRGWKGGDIKMAKGDGYKRYMRYYAQYCCIMNPVSGKKRGQEIYDTYKNQFINNGINHSLFKTETAQQVETVVQRLDPKSTDGIIVIGGDGTFHEVINGLSRNANPQAMRIPIGVIPAGSGNSLANTLGLTSPEEAVSKIIARKARALDLLKVTKKDGFDKIAFCVVSWGLHARTVFDSEQFRAFGNRRFVWSAYWNVVFRRHQASIKFKGLKILAKGDPAQPRQDDALALFANAVNVERVEEIEGQRWLCLGNAEWKGPLGYLLVSKIQELEKGFKVSPFAKIDDGLMDVLLVPTSNMWKVGQFLHKVFSDQHLSLPYVYYMKVHEIEVTPLTNSSPLCVDGEMYPLPQNHPVTIQTHPSTSATVFY